MSKKSKSFNPFDLSYLDPRNMPRWEKKFLGLIFKTIKKFFALSLKVSPTITVLFFRHRFGIDYLSLNKLVMANIIVWLFTLVPSTAAFNSYSNNYTSSPLSVFLALVVTVLSVIHYQESHNNFQHNPNQNSNDTGNSFLAKYLKLANKTAKLIVEPLIAIIGGGLIISLGSISGALILLGGITLFLEENAHQQQLAKNYKNVNNTKLNGQNIGQIHGQSYATWAQQVNQNQKIKKQSIPLNQNPRTRVARRPRKRNP